MSVTKAYEEVIDFIAAGSSPAAVAAFRPSEASRADVADLFAREKLGGLGADETTELNDYLKLEHLMRLAKTRAHTVPDRKKCGHLPQTDRWLLNLHQTGGEFTSALCGSPSE